MNDIMTICNSCNYKNNPQDTDVCLYCGREIDTLDAKCDWMRGYIKECIENNRGYIYGKSLKYDLIIVQPKYIEMYISKFNHHFANLLKNIGLPKYTIKHGDGVDMLKVMASN